MKVGAMNNPHKNLLEEAKMLKKYGLEYMELTIEAPEATPEKVAEKREQLLDVGLPLTGHMPWFFQITSPYKSIRNAMVCEAVRVIEAAAALNMPYVTVHPDFLKLHRKMEEIVPITVQSLIEIMDSASEHGIQLCFENFERKHMPEDELAKIFDALPKLGFTLDVGHAFMGEAGTDYVAKLITRFSTRLRNVHIHDNFGVNDDHLPLGAGKLDYKAAVKELKKAGYDGNLTLEIHSHDRDYIQVSKEKLMKLI
ncbi:MAG: sugar phosphate isomerase/epimerase [Candidatus Altiarchaeota archaeon]